MFAVGRGLHLLVAALVVPAGQAPRRVGDGGVGILTIQRKAAGQGALHVLWERRERRVNAWTQTCAEC